MEFMFNGLDEKIKEGRFIKNNWIPKNGDKFLWESHFKKDIEHGNRYKVFEIIGVENIKHGDPNHFQGEKYKIIAKNINDNSEIAIFTELKIKPILE